MKRTIAWTAAVSLVVALGASLARGADPASAAAPAATSAITGTNPATAGAAPAAVSPAQQAPVAAGTADAMADEVRFPRRLGNDRGNVVVHAPQVEAWRDYEQMDALAAVEATLTGKKPVVGSARFTASTVADVATHTVTIYNVRVTETKFPKASAAEAKALDELMRSVVRQTPQKMPLDVVLRSLDDTVIPASATGLSMAPPEIHYSSEPAVLVGIDGEPIKVPVEDTKLSYVANTNWDLYFHGGESRWYLLNDRQWLSTAKKSSIAGPWQLTTKLPKDFKRLPDDANFRATIAQVPPTVTSGAIPRVIVSTKPAELIVTTGLPILVAIPGTDLSFVDNTDSDVFKLGNDWYYLVSGRWFQAQNLAGPWSSVTQLPEQFSRIPKDHPRGDVRVSISGTEEAKLAAIEADIPRKAEIKRTATPGIQVTFNGDPQFEQVEKLPVYRATNSAYDVLRVGTTYYLCYNAAWWMSTVPAGPWAVATAVPPEIYKIPPTSPTYSCTYVHVYASDDETVTTGYTSGYTGTFTVGVSLMYGTGYYYPPYYYPGYYPIYYPYPVSYGRGAWYNPATGNFGGAEAVYGPYGGAGRAAMYNPQTGTYGRASAVWDRDEFAASAAAYNPRTGTGVATNRYRNEDGAWGESLVMRNDSWVHTQSHFADGKGTVDFNTSRGTSGSTQMERQGDTIHSSTEASRGDRSVSSQGEWTREGGQGSFETSGGASGEFSRDVENGRVTGSSEISKGDQSATSKVVRGEEGSARQITGSGGEQVTVAYDRSEGDLYAAKDGNVYKRDENGNWSQQGGGSAQPTAAAARGLPSAQQRTTTSQSQIDAQMQAAQRNRTMPSTSTQGLDNDPSASRNRQLEHDYRARSGGYDSFNQRRSGGFQGGRARRGR